VYNDKAPNFAADRCLKYNYFCYSFVISQNDKGRLRYTFLSTLSPVSSLETDESAANVVIAAYEKLKPPTNRDLIARFSFETRGSNSEDKWLKNLEMQYFLLQDSRSDGYFQQVLRICQIAMHQEPPRPVNFNNWIAGEDLSSGGTKFGNDFKRYIRKALELWVEATEEKELSEYFDFLLLAFLDMFCRSFPLDVTTIYDPIKKALFVKATDVYMLIVSVNYGNYIIVRSDGSNDQARNSQRTIVSRIQRKSSDEWDSSSDSYVFEMFQEAMKRSGHRAKFTDIQDEDIWEMDHERSLVEAMIVKVMNIIPGYTLDQEALASHVVFHRDLITAVVSSAIEESFQSALLKSQNNASFKSSMVDIITQEK